MTLGTECYKHRMFAFQFLAALCAGLFSGASIYINLVEHPARMTCGTAAALAQWAPSYKRATIMQASLAALGFLCAIAAWIQGAGTGWLIGGILLGLVIPFTLLVILPTNKKLLNPQLEKDSVLALDLLKRWNQLHAVRSVLSGASFVVFLFSLGGKFH